MWNGYEPQVILPTKQDTVNLVAIHGYMDFC